jgi:uncharacterized protein with PIN domain
VIVDSSAVIAILLREPGYEPVLAELAKAQLPGVSPRKPLPAELDIGLRSKV